MKRQAELRTEQIEAERTPSRGLPRECSTRIADHPPRLAPRAELAREIEVIELLMRQIAEADAARCGCST